MIDTVASLNTQDPDQLNHAIHTAFVSHLTKDKISTRSDANGDENEKIVNKDARLPALFLACGSFREDYEVTKRENLIANLLVVGHHPSLCEYSPLYTCYNR